MVKKTEEIRGNKISFEFAPRRDGDPAIILASAQKAFEVLGWKAVHSCLDNLIDSTRKVYNNTSI